MARRAATALERQERELNKLLGALPESYVAEHGGDIRAQALSGFTSADETDEREDELADEAAESEDITASAASAKGGDTLARIRADIPNIYDEPWERELLETEDLAAELEEAHQNQLAADKLRRDESRSLSQARKKAQQKAADEADYARKVAVQTAADTTAEIRRRVTGAADYIGNAPTPGGIATVALLLALLVFAILPVHGEPRFVWLWLVLTGRAQLREERAGLTIAEQAEQEAIARGVEAGIQAITGLPATTLPPAALPAVEAGFLTGLAGTLGLGTMPGLDRYIHG